MQNNSLIEQKILPLFLLSFLILYPLVFIWQGGDLTDAGYHATNFHFFFKSLALDETNSLTFLTDCIGGFWMLLFPNLGIIGLKFLYLIFLYTSLYFSYKILRPYAPNRNILLLLLLVGIFFSTRYTMFVFSHDICSWTFLVLSIYFFTKTSTSNLKLLLSGVFFGLAVLARFADLSLLVLLPFTLLIAHFTKIQNLKTSLKLFSYFLLGFLVLVLGFLTILWLNNALQSYILNLGFFHFSFKTNAANSYSTNLLLRSYFKELIELSLHLIAVIIGYWLLSFFSKRKEKWASILVVLALLYFTIYFYFGFSYSSKFRFLVPALCLPILFWIIKTKNTLSLLSLVILAFTFSQVLGTNTGLLLKMSFGFTLLIPICFLYLYRSKDFFFKKFSFEAKPILLFAFLVISTIGFTARIGWIFNVDNGFHCRRNAVYSIEHPKMKYIFTNYIHADKIRDLSDLVEENTDNNSTLFIYGHKPMLYYLTGNYPAIKEYWLGNNVYSPEQVFNALEASISKNKKWPVILEENIPILGKDGAEALQDFLNRHEYQLVDSYVGKVKVWKRMCHL